MSTTALRSAWAILVCGAVIGAIAFGIRHSFGLYLQPISMANGWGREVFAFAMAIQNLVWGIAQPFAGYIADRWGAGRVIIGGGLLYTLGLGLMALPLEAPAFILAAGLLIGLGLAGTTFPIIFGVISRVMPAEKRSLAFGIAMSVGSFGQFIMLPVALGLIDGIGWAQSLLVMTALSTLILPLALVLARPGASGTPAVGPTAGAALRTALGHRDFWLLSLGFFVCGFQVVFIGIHLPAFLDDQGIAVSVASTTLALIGLVNIAGTLGAGWLGARFSKPMLLVWIYLGRAVCIALFVLLPITAASTYLFGVLMGLFWLSTVPLTNGIVASMYGVKNMAMLGGIVFLVHQLGSFLGGWLGGLIYDRLGSYDYAWGIAIALSLIAALLNLPIRERPVEAPAEVARA